MGTEAISESQTVPVNIRVHLPRPLTIEMLYDVTAEEKNAKKKRRVRRDEEEDTKRSGRSVGNSKSAI